MVTRAENFFFSQEIDHCERLVSLLEYIASLGVGNSSSATQDWSKLSVHDDELFSSLEKGIYYRGMINLRTEPLLVSMQAIAQKFGEMRERLEVLHVPVDVSRGTVIECNHACRKIIRRLEKLSVTFAVCLHAVIRVHDEYAAISIKPNHSSYDSVSCSKTIVHLDDGVTLYKDGNPRCQEMLDFLLVDEDNVQQHRIRNHNDELKGEDSHPIRQSVENARRLANYITSPKTDAPVPISMQVVVAVDLTAFNSTDDGVVEAENTLAACKASVLELRKTEKAATIQSMRAMVTDLEEMIRLEEYKQEQKKEVLAAPWNYGDYIGRDSQKRDDRGEEELGKVKEEAEDIALAQRENADRSSPPSSLTHSPVGTLMRDRMRHSSSSISNNSQSPPRSPYRYDESDREEAEKEQNTPQGRRRRYRNFLADNDDPTSIAVTSAGISATEESSGLQEGATTKEGGETTTSVSVMQASLDQTLVDDDCQDHDQRNPSVHISHDPHIDEDWGDPWVNQRSLSLTDRLEVADDAEMHRNEGENSASDPAPTHSTMLGLKASFVSPERELPTPGKGQPSPFPGHHIDFHSGGVGSVADVYVSGRSPEREDGDDHDHDNDDNDGGLLEPVAHFEEGRSVAQASLALSPARASSVPLHSLGIGLQVHNDANIGAVADNLPLSVISSSSPDAHTRNSITSIGSVNDVVRVSVDGHQEEVRISNSSLYVPADAALVDDDEEEEVLRSREHVARARIAVQEVVTLRMNAEQERQTEVLHSPDRRRTAPLAAAAAVAFQGHKYGGDSNAEMDVHSIWHFNHNLAFHEQVQEEEVDYKSVDNSLAEVSSSPNRRGSRDSDLILTPDGRKNPHGRIFISSPVDDEDDNGSDDEGDKSPQMVMAPTSPQSGSPPGPVECSAELGGPPNPTGASPPLRASNPGLDPGPCTSTKASSSSKGGVIGFTDESSATGRASTEGSHLEESMHRMLNQFIVGRESVDSIASGNSVDIDALSRQAYAAIRDAVLDDVLRESRESTASKSLSGSPRAGLRRGVDTINIAKEEDKDETALSSPSTRSRGCLTTPLRSSQNISSTDTGVGTIPAPSRRSPPSPKRRQKSKKLKGGAELDTTVTTNKNKATSRLQQARAVYAAQQRATAAAAAAGAAKSPVKAKIKENTMASIEKDDMHYISLRDAVPAIAATAVAAGTLRVLASAVEVTSFTGASGAPPPPMDSPSTILPTMSPRRLSSSSPLLLPSSPEALNSRKVDKRAEVTMSMGSSADWSNGVSSVVDSPPRPPSAPIRIYKNGKPFTPSDHDDYDAGKSALWSGRKNKDDGGLRDLEVSVSSIGDDIGPEPNPEPQITSDIDSGITSRPSSSRGMLSASTNTAGDTSFERPVCTPQVHINAGDSADSSSSKDKGWYKLRDLYFDSATSEQSDIHVSTSGMAHNTGRFPTRNSLNGSVSSWGSIIDSDVDKSANQHRASSRQSPMRGSTDVGSGGLRKSQEVRRAISIIEDAVMAAQARKERESLEAHIINSGSKHSTNDIAPDAALEESLLDDISLDYGQNIANSGNASDPHARASSPGEAPGSLDLSASLSLASITSGDAHTRSRPGTAESRTSSWGAKVDRQQAEMEEFEQLESALTSRNGPASEFNDNLDTGIPSSPPFSHLQQEHEQEEKVAREALRAARGLLEDREKQRKDSRAARRQHRAKYLLQQFDGSATIGNTRVSRVPPNADGLDAGRADPHIVKDEDEIRGISRDSTVTIAETISTTANVPSSRTERTQSTPAHLKDGVRQPRGGEAFEIDFSSPTPSSSQLPPPRQQEQTRSQMHKQHSQPQRAQAPSAHDNLGGGPQHRREERRRRVVAQAEAREAARKGRSKSDHGAHDHFAEYPFDDAGRPLLPVSAASASTAGAYPHEAGGLRQPSKPKSAATETGSFEQDALPAPPARLGASSSVRARGERALRSKLSNVSRVKNAITNVCLAGPSNQDIRNKCFAALDHWHSGEGAEKRRRRLTSMALAMDAPDAFGGSGSGPSAVPISSAVSQFVVLFYHSKTLSFRGLYAVDPITASLYRIHGRGPLELPTEKISGFLKYETGSRSFVPLAHVKSLTSTCDAVSVEPSSLKKGF